MRNLTREDFTARWPRGNQAIIEGILKTQDSVWSATGITTILRLAHFLAQISHESGQGTEMEESLNYRESALLKQWPHRFSAAQATQFGRNSAHKADQRMIAILAYGGRMGNAPDPSEDGYTFRGRGLLQITGKDSYRSIGHLCGLDLINHPELAIDPLHTLLVAATEFKASGCLPYADQDDLLAVSSLINLGHVTHNSGTVIGWEVRQDWLHQWKSQFNI